jgi:hypothetical protein
MRHTSAQNKVGLGLGERRKRGLPAPEVNAANALMDTAHRSTIDWPDRSRGWRDDPSAAVSRRAALFRQFRRHIFYRKVLIAFNENGAIALCQYRVVPFCLDCHGFLNHLLADFAPAIWRC